jgi:hypothetical protein
MTVVMNSFVDEVVRWLDADLCEANREHQFIAFELRAESILHLLEKRKVVRKSLLGTETWWSPDSAVGPRFANPNIDQPTKWQSVAIVARGEPIGNYEVLAKKLIAQKLDFVLSKTRAAFDCFHQGLIGYEGKGADGLRVWSSTSSRRKLKKVDWLNSSKLS